MKRILAAFTILALVASSAIAGVVSKPFTFTNNSVADANQVNADFDTLYTLVNGNLDSSNIEASAIGSSEIADNSVNFNKIDWGTGANQVRGTETTTWRIGQGGANYLDIANPSLTGNRTWTLQDSSDTFVGRATTDTLTNKTLTTPTISSFVNATHSHQDAAGGGTLDAAAITGSVTGSGSVVKATSPTIVTPTIASFTNATHNHQNAAGGGTLDAAAITGSVTGSGSVVKATSPAITSPTITGTIILNSGVTLNAYSDVATTLKVSIDGSTGKIIGAPVRAGTYNINLVRATTSVAGDSIKVQCGGATCSATNPGFIVMPSTTAGALTQFTITADVTLNLSSATWGADGNGNITGRIIRALFVNDNGTLRTCAALLGNRDTVLTTDTNATASSVNLSEEILCNTAVGSATNTAMEFGYFRADFTDSSNANIVQSGVNDIVIGKSGDMIMQPFNGAFGGFSSPPTVDLYWYQAGREIKVFCVTTAAGTSNANTFSLLAPTKTSKNHGGMSYAVINNSIQSASPGSIIMVEDTNTIYLTKDISGSAFNTWTTSNAKSSDFVFSYKVGPAASFVE